MSEKKTILLVEPNEGLRNLFKRHWLEKKSNLVIIEAESGSIAQCILQESSVDAIVTDNFMPEMNGQELIRWVRQQPTLAHLPIIAMSMYSEYADQGQRVILPLHEAGADFVLSKLSSQAVAYLDLWNWQRPSQASDHL